MGFFVIRLYSIVVSQHGPQPHTFSTALCSQHTRVFAIRRAPFSASASTCFAVCATCFQARAPAFGTDPQQSTAFASPPLFPTLAFRATAQAHSQLCKRPCPSSPTHVQLETTHGLQAACLPLARGEQTPQRPATLSIPVIILTPGEPAKHRQPQLRHGPGKAGLPAHL